MELQDLIGTHFRTQIDDEAPPYLVSDDEALAFAIDAQDMFVRLTGGFADMTLPAADDPTNLRLHDLSVTIGSPYTALSPYILRVRSARLLTAKIDVKVISEGDLKNVPFSDYGWTRGLTLDDTDTGDVRYMVLGVREDQVRWVRVPIDTDTCRLHVYRLPYPRIATQKSPLEIREEHHLHLVKWMKHLAYSKQDAEIYDKALAAKNEEDFRSYCAQAKQEADRRRYKPRTVQYGGL